MRTAFSTPGMASIDSRQAVTSPTPTMPISRIFAANSSRASAVSCLESSRPLGRPLRGKITAAATTGRMLVARLASGRDEYQLTIARLNLCAALLALDTVAEARPVAEAGWPQAKRFELQKEWADYLSLLAALEQRAAAAARLCGYAIAAYEMFEGRRDVNEAAAFDRARRLAVSTLGDSEFERLQAEGRSLRDEDIAAIAFGTRDA